MIHFASLKFSGALVLALATLMPVAKAGIINFDTLQPLANNSTIPQGFGSTAAVSVIYQSLPKPGTTNPGDFVAFWNAGYANLNSVIFDEFSAILDVTLTATSASQNVLLNSFEIAQFSGGGGSTALLEVTDGNGDVLANFTASGPFQASGTTASTLSPNVAAHTVNLLVGFNNDTGINDINFSTVSAGSTAPEPSSIVLFGVGMLSVAAWRFKKLGRMN